MTVSEYIAQFLVKNNINDVFLIDGSAAASMIVAVSENPNLKYYCPFHEQAGAFAVDGYYKSSHRISAMIATSGPAGQNLINGIAASWYDSIPALYLTGNVNSKFMRPNKEVRQRGFQEHDIVSMVKGVTKYAIMVTRPEDIRYHLEQALYMAQEGRPGPVLLDLPMDVQKAEIDPDRLIGFQSLTSSKLNYDYTECIKLIQQAKRPIILLGGGVWLANACEETRELINKLQIPFFVTWNMIDFCSSDDPLYGGRVGTFGGDGRNFGIQNCDLLIAIGSRISGRITGGMIDAFARAAKKIVVNIDKPELDFSPIPIDIPINMDVKRFVVNLNHTLPNKLSDWSSWVNRVISWRNKYRVVRPEYYEQKENINPYVFINELSSRLDENAIVVVEAGGNCVISSQAFNAKIGQRFFSNNGNSSLGYALPASIGAAIANPNKQIICFVGDGGINFNIQELQTIKHYNLPIKIFIFSNNAYGITKAFRDTNYKSNYAGVDPDHGVEIPNFMAIADAYGLFHKYIHSQNELDLFLDYILKENRPVVTSVNMKGFYDYQPKLGWSSPIEDQYPFLSRDEFRENMIIEPIDGWEDPVYPGKIKK